MKLAPCVHGIQGDEYENSVCVAAAAMVFVLCGMLPNAIMAKDFGSPGAV